MFRAEILKLTTTTAPRIALAVGAVGLALTQLAFVTLIPALESGRIGPGREALGDDLPSLDLATATDQLAALSPLGAPGGGGSIGVAVLAVVLLGTLTGTADHRFGGIVGAVLAQPRRGRLLVSKAAAVGLAGLLTGVVYAIVSMATLLGTLLATDTAVALDPVEIAGALLRGTLATSCLALIGLAVGVLARSQLAGVLWMLAILALEPVVQSTIQLATGDLPTWGHLLPMSLASAVIGVGDGPSPALATIALLALTALVLTLAGAALRRRDV
jgi:ABC-2 type transport system permease protein